MQKLGQGWSESALQLRVTHSMKVAEEQRRLLDSFRR